MVKLSNNRTEAPISSSEVSATLQIVCYVAVFIVSITSDVLIFLVIGFDKKLHTKTNFLLVSLAITDCLTVLVGVPISVVNLRDGGSLTDGILCNATGFMILTLFLTSNFNMALIAIHRYVLIVRNVKYRETFSKHSMIVAVLLIWLMTILLAFPPLFGWGNYSYNAHRAHCMVEWGYSKSYLVFLQVAAFPMPFSVMSFCYYKVVIHTSASKKRLQASADRHNLVKKIRELRLTFMLMLVLGVFLTLDTPYAVLIYWEGFGNDKVPQLYSFLALLLAYSNRMCDFWIYAGLSKKFRRSCFRLLKRFCCKHQRQRVHPASTNSDQIPPEDSTDSSHSKVINAKVGR